MKKFVIIILSVAILLGTYILIMEMQNNKKGNYYLARNEFLALFKPTIFLHMEFDLESVEYLNFSSTIYNGNVYDKDTIQETLDYLNDLPLVLSSKEEIPNVSADAYMYFADSEKNAYWLYLYGEVFIEDLQKQEIFRVKHGNHIITELEEIIETKE